MKKRIVHVTQETVFDEITDKVKVTEALEKLKKKWETQDFSMSLFFNKQIKHAYPGGPPMRSGRFEFIRAYKPR